VAVSPLEVGAAMIVETVDYLREWSLRERVVLWLGRRDGDRTLVREVYVPIQVTAADLFRIPAEGMDALFSHMRAERLMVAAQVHTHPAEAFHSPADDEWAIVRHEGGLSLVLPRFCQTTTASTFVEDAKVYRLDADDTFVGVEPGLAYRVTP
jgi:hypothetical protein